MTRTTRAPGDPASGYAGGGILDLQANAICDYEAVEVLGGSGYIEEASCRASIARPPVNSIWEGSGSMHLYCLDVLRAIERTPNAVDVLHHELGDGDDARLKASTNQLDRRLLARVRNDSCRRGLLCANWCLRFRERY